MEPSLDDIRTELASIHDQLLALPANDFGSRSALKERQYELRQLSHKLIDGKPLHDGEALRAAYLRMSDLRDRLLDLHLSHSSQSAGDTGIDDSFTTAVNKAIDSGLGIDEVEARLAEILRQIRSSN